MKKIIAGKIYDTATAINNSIVNGIQNVIVDANFFKEQGELLTGARKSIDTMIEVGDTPTQAVNKLLTRMKEAVELAEITGGSPLQTKCRTTMNEAIEEMLESGYNINQMNREILQILFQWGATIQEIVRSLNNTSINHRTITHLLFVDSRNDKESPDSYRDDALILLALMDCIYFAQTFVKPTLSSDDASYLLPG